jgi:hypothetical protein
MPAWKVLFVTAFGLVCLGLALATIIVPLSLIETWHRWLWLVGLLFATVCMGTLFTLFLKISDRTLSRNNRR